MQREGDELRHTAEKLRSAASALAVMDGPLSERLKIAVEDGDSFPLSPSLLPEHRDGLRTLYQIVIGPDEERSIDDVIDAMDDAERERCARQITDLAFEVTAEEARLEGPQAHNVRRL